LEVDFPMCLQYFCICIQSIACIFFSKMLYVENYLFQFFFFLFLSYFYLLRQQWLWPLASIALVLAVVHGFNALAVCYCSSDFSCWL